MVSIMVSFSNDKLAPHDRSAVIQVKGDYQLWQCNFKMTEQEHVIAKCKCDIQQITIVPMMPTKMKEINKIETLIQ